MFDDYSKKDVLWSQSYLSLQNVTTPPQKKTNKKILHVWEDKGTEAFNIDLWNKTG